MHVFCFYEDPLKPSAIDLVLHSSYGKGSSAVWPSVGSAYHSLYVGPHLTKQGVIGVGHDQGQRPLLAGPLVIAQCVENRNQVVCETKPSRVSPGRCNRGGTY
eukprot:scaffold3061_cov430-Prasinococcus_capsulatus_cf.AAC.5